METGKEMLEMEMLGSSRSENFAKILKKLMDLSVTIVSYTPRSFIKHGAIVVTKKVVVP